MRRSVIAATVFCVALAGGTSGCSSSVDGSAQAGTSATVRTAGGPTSGGSTSGSSAGSRPGSTSDAPGSATGSADSAVSEPGSPDAGTGPPPSGTDLPFAESPPSRPPASPLPSDPAAAPDVAALDEASANWFRVYCAGTAEIGQYNALNTSGLELPALKEARVAAYSGISISASTTVGLLQATAPPTFVGGGDLEESAVKRFSAISDIYGRAALSVQASTPQTEADLEALVSAIEQQAAASIPNSMAQVSAGVLAAAKRLPECQAVLN